jgi:hypothetical protein
MKIKYALGLVMTLFAAACEQMETQENKYADAQAAITAGAIQQGWIPTFLPLSATNIRERHNVDTNEVWLQFSMNSNELDIIEKSCQRIASAEIKLPRKSGGAWWPDVLKEQERDALLQSNEYMFFYCENTGSMALRADGRKAFYWYHG